MNSEYPSPTNSVHEGDLKTSNDARKCTLASRGSGAPSKLPALLCEPDLALGCPSDAVLLFESGQFTYCS